MSNPNNPTPFINGLYAKTPHPDAPDWVVCKLSIKRADLLAYLQASDAEWINAEVKEKKNDPDKLNVFLDTWKPREQEQAPPSALPGMTAPEPPPVEYGPNHADTGTRFRG